MFNEREKESELPKFISEEISDVQQLNFLFILCPYMEYFRVECINTMDIQLFIRAIFKKIDQNYDHRHLRSLCINVSTTDDQIIENIEKMIKYEKLISHFMVKRLEDAIYLQWT